MRRGLMRGVVSLTSLVLLIPGGVAFAQYPGGGEAPPTVKGEKFFRGTARTGSDVLLLVVLALILITSGLVAYYTSRRGTRREI